MKISIVYNTTYGNGRMIAEYLAGRLNEQGHNTNIYSMKDTRPEEIPESDLYIFSTPTHIGTAPFRTKLFLSRFRPKRTGAQYSLIATHADPKGTRANAKMNNILKEKGMTYAGELTILMNGISGPAESGYEHKLDEFASTITSTASVNTEEMAK